MRHATMLRATCMKSRWPESRNASSQDWFEPHDRRFSKKFKFIDECCIVGKDLDILFSAVLKVAMDEFPSIAMDADVVGGVPRIAGTRIPVYMILDAVEHYGTVEGALKSYSALSQSQVKDALSFASRVLEQPLDNEPTTSAG